jgi:acetyl-CoA C-acetyltransferase
MSTRTTIDTAALRDAVICEPLRTAVGGFGGVFREVSGVKDGGVRLEDRLAQPRMTAGGIRHPVPGGMIETTENVHRPYGISREEQDELALRSHQRAVAAHEIGAFAHEIVALAVENRGAERLIDRDEHPRADRG